MSALVSARSKPLVPTNSSWAVTIFTRLPMVALTAILLMIALRYFIHPVPAGAAAGIAFTSPGGITVARIGFGAFPLAFATLFLSSLFSRQYLLVGLRAELMLLAIVIGVRLLGLALAHSTETAKLLVPEVILAALCIFAIRLASRRNNGERLPLES